MHANQQNKVSAEYLSHNLGVRISSDVTVEFINPQTSVSDVDATVDLEIDNIKDRKEEDSDSYFSPLTYCSVTMEEGEEMVFQNKPGNEEMDTQKKGSTKDRKSTIGTQCKENSSSVCNGVDANSVSKIKKKFLCHICKKTFRWSTDLKRHFLSHTGERPFKCSMCFATFTRNCILQRHKMKIHQCLSPSETSQLNKNVAKNIMEIKSKLSELQEVKGENENVSVRSLMKSKKRIHD